ncbi:MAG: hypothetical protein E3J72_18035 [Planctomycetota bacterium]|nr:MAG: hypothetical protein E3J72_18035 [Planctomycetota bacterium]
MSVQTDKERSFPLAWAGAFVFATMPALLSGLIWYAYAGLWLYYASAYEISPPVFVKAHAYAPWLGIALSALFWALLILWRKHARIILKVSITVLIVTLLYIAGMTYSHYNTIRQPESDAARRELIWAEMKGLNLEHGANPDEAAHFLLGNKHPRARYYLSRNIDKIEDAELRKRVEEHLKNNPEKEP